MMAPDFGLLLIIAAPVAEEVMTHVAALVSLSNFVDDAVEVLNRVVEVLKGLISKQDRQKGEYQIRTWRLRTPLLGNGDGPLADTVEAAHVYSDQMKSSDLNERHTFLLRRRRCYWGSHRSFR